MVGDIKRSEIQVLLTAYHSGEGDEAIKIKKSFLRNTPGSVPTFITALQRFIEELNQSSPSVDPLAPEALFKLLILLLSREVRTHTFSKESKHSERLARKLEEKFDTDEFQELKNHFKLNTLDFDKFISICKLASVDPQENEDQKETQANQNHAPQFNDDEMFIITSQSKSLSEKFSLLKVSSNHYYLFFNITQTHYPLLRKLLSHGALGELEQAEAIWRKHPDLLDCYGTVYHPNHTYVDGQASVAIPFHHNPGRYKYIHLTYLQMLWLNEEYEEAKPIEAILGAKEVARQFFEVFPDSVIKKYNFDFERAVTLLNAVFKAIANDKSIASDKHDQMNAATRETLDALYVYAKPTPDHQTGLVFDPNFYFAALKLYDQYARAEFNKNSSKHEFWCIRVEEWLAGCLGTGYLRPHAQGIGSITHHRRGCAMADGSSYFAFRRDGDSFPGMQFFVGYHGHGQRKRGWGEARQTRFSNIMSNKKYLGEQLMQSCNQALKQNRIT